MDPGAACHNGNLDPVGFVNPAMRGTREIYEFGPFRLEVKERRLLRDGVPVPSRAKVFDTLRVLVENHGRLVGKDDLMKAVWPDAVVEEGNLAHNLAVLRKALGEKPEDHQYIVTVPALARRWEGAARPHHFAGVATVVTKLFGIVQPHLALFGRKDYQQAAMVRQLVDDLNLGVVIHVRPTFRERDGLAMSSRNVYLSPDERRIAPLLSQALRIGRQRIVGGMSDVAAIERIMRQTLEQAPTIHVEYLAVCDPDSLEPLSVVAARAVILGAVRIGSIRLIDNLLVNMPGGKSRATN